MAGAAPDLPYSPRSLAQARSKAFRVRGARTSIEPKECRMTRHFSSAVCAAALLLAGASTIALSPPANAAVNVRIGFDFFHDRLSAHGRWLHHPIWGDVWRPHPRLVGADFQPYTNGYWQYTDEYGWYWVSDDPFDDVVYHYGRWLYDPQWGWLWLHGY